MKRHQTDDIALRLVGSKPLRLCHIEHEVVEKFSHQTRESGLCGGVLGAVGRHSFGGVRPLMCGQRIDHLLNATPAGLLLGEVVGVFFLQMAAIADQVEQHS